MKLHVFFSVHEPIFGAITNALRREHGLAAVSGFVWGEDGRAFLAQQGYAVQPLTVYTTDVLSRLDETPADLEYLAQWEQRAGVPLQHMIFAERHLLKTYRYDQILRLAELLFRRIEADFDGAKPDVYFSEDVACLTSYIHWAVAKSRGVKIVFMNNARFPRRVTTYNNPFQQYDLLDRIFPGTPPGTLTDADLAEADRYIREFRERPAKPPGLLFRSALPLGSRFDLGRLRAVAERWARDRHNPTLVSPVEAVAQRGRRLARNFLAERGLYETPPADERFVLYPLHLQPEATTLVLAPYFLNQLALVEDLAKSLPAGFRLYVKEHVISRGRWPVGFYEQLRRIPSVRLLSPSENTFELIRKSAAVAVITGTVGWEGLLLDKPVVTFGRVFYNVFPLVHRAGELPKHAWPGLFRKALFGYHGDPELLRTFVACVYKATFAGTTGNPSSWPEIMDPDNVRKLVRVVGSQIGLTAALQGGLQSA